MVQILALLAEELNIRIPGGTFSWILARPLAIIGLFLFIFKKYVTMMVDDANVEEAQSNIRSERAKDIDH